MADINYPPVSFYFEVTIEGASKNDARFQEISGLEASMNIEEIREGGVNGYTHKLPTGVKYSNLVLKRGLLAKNSNLLDWIRKQLVEDETTLDNFETKEIKVSLMNEKGSEVMVWNIIKAYPIKWSISDLNSMDSSVVIETIEFAYQKFSL